jgi:hypothetical protein
MPNGCYASFSLSLEMERGNQEMSAANQFDLDVRVATPGDTSDAQAFPTVKCLITKVSCGKFTCRSCTCASCITQCPIGCL